MSEDFESPETALQRPKIKKKPSKLQEYTVMRLEEDEWLFAIVRTTREHERYTLIPTEREVAEGRKIPSYERIIYIISPFVNHLDGTDEPSCNCPHWMTQKTRCVHLRKFFSINPELDPGEKPKPKPPKVPTIADQESQSNK